MKRLGSYLQSIRKQHGLSIRSVEKRSKALYPADRSMWISHTYLRKLEADGYQAPGPNKLKALAAVYRIDYNTILDVAGYRSAEEGHRGPRCDFANGETPNQFAYPALRAIILHFWLAYDHPFLDGNGRTARALFYWSMLRNRYWLCEFISISHIILKEPARYGRAFLYTETDENDLTYFILFQLGVIRRAVGELHEYISRKSEELRVLESELRGVVVLNHRQRALVGHALRHPSQLYTIQSHRVSHNVVHQTARKDLLNLAERGLLMAEKAGRNWRFTPAVDLEEKLGKLS